MRKHRRAALARVTSLAVVALATATLAGGCTLDGGPGATRQTLRIMVPAAPGGGWDQTSRTAQQAIEAVDPAQRVEVFNVPGAGGTIGLARLVNERGNGRLLMTMGLVMVGAIETSKSRVRLSDVTPIARLADEYEMIVVPADSKYRTLADFVADWRENPRRMPIAGGSAGGADEILAGLMAKAAGIDPRQVNYVAHSGGGEAVNAILSGRVAAGVSGASEFVEHVRSGKIRALGVSAPRRIEGVDAPTLEEGGLDVVLANWRGMVAPPGISDADRKALEETVTKMHGSARWRAALESNGWVDSFQVGQPFADFLEAEQARVRGLLRDLGRL